MPNKDPSITTLIETFTTDLVAAVETSMAERIQAALGNAFGASPKRKPGRPPKQATAVAPSPAAKTKRPKQLCPVPGCKNLAAPVFGMVCKEHKNVAKSTIKRYRQERKAKTKPAAVAKPTAAKKIRVTPKVTRARKLQGQYLGALKSLTGEARAKVKQTAKDKGVAEAVKLAGALKKSKA